MQFVCTSAPQQPNLNYSVHQQNFGTQPNFIQLGQNQNFVNSTGLLQNHPIFVNNAQGNIVQIHQQLEASNGATYIQGPQQQQMMGKTQNDNILFINQQQFASQPQQIHFINNQQPQFQATTSNQPIQILPAATTIVCGSNLPNEQPQNAFVQQQTNQGAFPNNNFQYAQSGQLQQSQLILIQPQQQLINNQQPLQQAFIQNAAVQQNTLMAAPEHVNTFKTLGTTQNTLNFVTNNGYVVNGIQTQPHGQQIIYLNSANQGPAQQIFQNIGNQHPSQFQVAQANAPTTTVVVSHQQQQPQQLTLAGPQQPKFIHVNKQVVQKNFQVDNSGYPLPQQEQIRPIQYEQNIRMHSGSISFNDQKKEYGNANLENFGTHPCTTAPVSRANTDELNAHIYLNQEMVSEKSLLNRDIGGGRRIFSGSSNGFNNDEMNFSRRSSNTSSENSGGNIYQGYSQAQNPKGMLSYNYLNQQNCFCRQEVCVCEHQKMPKRNSSSLNEIQQLLLQEEKHHFSGDNNVPSYSALRFAPYGQIEEKNNHQKEQEMQAKRQREAAEILGDLDIFPSKQSADRSDSSVDGSQNKNIMKVPRANQHIRKFSMNRFKQMRQKTLQVMPPKSQSTKISIPIGRYANNNQGPHHGYQQSAQKLSVPSDSQQLSCGKIKKPKKKTKLTQLQKTLLTSEFKRDPLWSSLKVMKMARFLNMRPTQVYKWNWNRKRARVNVEEGTAKRLRYYCFKMEKNEEADGEMNSPAGSSSLSNRMLYDQGMCSSPYYRPRQKKTSTKDDIIIFKVERNVGRKIAPNGIQKTMKV